MTFNLVINNLCHFFDNISKSDLRAWNPSVEIAALFSNDSLIWGLVYLALQVFEALVAIWDPTD